MDLFKRKNKDISESVEKETKPTKQEVLSENPDAIKTAEEASKLSSKMDSHIPSNMEYTPTLTYKEQKSLKKSKYAENKEKYPKTFLIRNKRTGRMAEINGFSPLQACSSIGWRSRHCKVVEVKDKKWQIS